MKCTSATAVSAPAASCKPLQPCHRRKPSACRATQASNGDADITPASRRAALALLSAGPLAAVAAAATAAVAADAELASLGASAAPDTTPTHHLFLDIGLCPEGVRTNRTLGDKTPFCTDPQPMGRIVIDLFGRVAPGSVGNITAAAAAGAYNGTALSKVLPGRYIVAGTQGPKRSGMVQAPEGLDPNPDLLSSAAFRLSHLRPGTVSLNLSENEDEEYVRQGKSYRPLSLLITTGPAPVPFLDEGNIVVGQVVEGLEVIQAITQVPTFQPIPGPWNKFAASIGDERANKTAAKWGRPLQAVIITSAGLL